MSSKNFAPFLFLIIMITMCGCAAQLKFRPDFDKSNAIFIEKSARELEIVNAIQPFITQTDKIIVASIEDPYTVDIPINYLIEDNLISNLTKSGYNVLERDPDMIKRFMSEENGKYKIGDIFNSDDVTNELGTVAIPNQKETDIKIKSADKIISFRLLECEILYELPEDVSLIEKDSALVKRLARTRLHIRVTDAKTSEIKLATILENEIQDEIPSNQISILSNIHYVYYDQALSNIKKEAVSAVVPVQQNQEPKKLGTILWTFVIAIGLALVNRYSSP